MAGGLRKKGAISDINVTPFVDIVLVLLVVLMVTAVQVVKGAIPVDLPTAKSGGDAAPATVNIVITKEGELFLDGAPTTEKAIGSKVKAETTTDPKLQAVIAADKKVEYDRVVRVIDVIKLNGVKSFALNISRPQSQ